MLGEDQEWLREISSNMDGLIVRLSLGIGFGEDGCATFNEFEIECRKKVIAEARAALPGVLLSNF